MSQALHIDSDRLWASLMAMATIGETANGGVSRLALTDEDRAARDLFVKWATDAGCHVHIDAMGNIFARRKGLDNTLAPVMTGSHIDSQPDGGRFDGIYGVMAGLEVVRTLNDHDIRTERPIDVVAWTNEEGARFAPAMLASGVYAGVFDLDFGLSRTDSQGISVKEALASIGYAGHGGKADSPIHAAFELHIEQGPILEAEETSIGVVMGAQGQRWYDVELVGQTAHAGTTPMVHRKDALLGLSRVSEAVNALGRAQGDDGRATIGMVNVSPNSRNVVPGRVSFSVEFRHPDDSVLKEMDHQFRANVTEISENLSLSFKIKDIFQYAPIKFDKRCIENVRKAAQQLGYSYKNMVSGAGHDACYLSRIAPTSMIFVPCVDGISHNEAEYIYPEWAAAGTNVLLRTMLDSMVD